MHSWFVQETYIYTRIELLLSVSYCLSIYNALKHNTHTERWLHQTRTHSYTHRHTLSLSPPPTHLTLYIPLLSTNSNSTFIAKNLLKWEKCNAEHNKKKMRVQTSHLNISTTQDFFSAIFYRFSFSMPCSQRIWFHALWDLCLDLQPSLAGCCGLRFVASGLSTVHLLYHRWMLTIRATSVKVLYKHIYKKSVSLRKPVVLSCIFHYWISRTLVFKFYDFHILFFFWALYP